MSVRQQWKADGKEENVAKAEKESKRKKIRQHLHRIRVYCTAIQLLVKLLNFVVITEI